MADNDYVKAEGVGVIGGSTGEFTDEYDRARKLHHLATADPEPERDGTMTGPAHEAKYDLERAPASAEYWRGVGVHPFENRALQPGDEGYVESDVEDEDEPKVETASVKPSNETAAAPRAPKA